MGMQNTAESVSLQRRVEGGRIERQEVRVRGEHVSALFTDQPIGTINNFGIKRLAEYLVGQFNLGWHPIGPFIGVSTKYAIGEAISEGFTTDQIAETMCESNSSLIVKAQGVAYAIRTAENYQKEGSTNQRWSDLSKLNRGLVMWFLATLRAKTA